MDVFTRIEYKEIFVDSLRCCIDKKGLILHAWCLMTIHVHLIFSSKESGKHSASLRDMKKYTSSNLLIEIDSNKNESRKEWMLKFFAEAGKNKSNNLNFQFWQQDNHPIEIYGPKVISLKIVYVPRLRVGYS